MVVIPARDEEARVGACITALAAQEGAPPFEVVLVLDACVDETEAVARRAAAAGGLVLRCVVGPGRGVGFARRAGFEVAAMRLRSLTGADDGSGRAPEAPAVWLASTDADSVVAPDWLAATATALAQGAAAVGGRIELDLDEAQRLPHAALSARAAEAGRRLAAVRHHTPAAEHHQFSGASLALSLAAYDRVGGLPAVSALEDEALERELFAAGLPVAYAASVRVTTSARTESRVPRGLAQVLRAARWRARTDEAQEPAVRPPGEPARFEDVLVVRPRPGSRGSDLHAALKSDTADLVLVLDGEHADPDAAAPLLETLRADPACVLARAAEPLPDPLGELVARPALNLHAPELAQLSSPLGRTWAARGAFLRSLELPAGDAVDLTVLLDAWAEHGLEAIVEHPLPDLRTATTAEDPPLAAYELLCVFADRFPEPPARSSAFADPTGTRRARLERFPPSPPPSPHARR